MKKTNKLKLGDTVKWRGGFGRELPIEAKVESIEICKVGSKYGRDVKSVDWDKVKRNVVVTLDNGHWAYGEQISKK